MTLSSTPATKPRLYYLDWLRVLSMLAVFLYHNNRFYNFGDWHVKNPLLSLASTIAENAIDVWLMPMLFVVSGAAIVFSLKSRGAGSFVKERFLRLAVPLVILGMFVLGPWQIYLERLSHGDFAGSFWQFLPHYFEGMYGFGGNFAWMGVHLWYLMLLFLFSLIFLGLFLPSRKSGLSPISKWSAFFAKPWALFLLFIPLAIATHLTDALGLGISRSFGGWDTFSYMLFLIYGYLLLANPRIMEILKKYCFASLAVASAATAIWLVVRYAVMPSPDDGFFFKDELRSISSWLFILAFFGLGARYLNSNNKYRSYANEAVLPFYVLHQPVILTIGYFVVQWTLPIAAKYFIIASGSFIAIMAIYELLVRRLNVLRFLMGMRMTWRGEKTLPAPENAA